MLGAEMDRRSRCQFSRYERCLATQRKRSWCVAPSSHHDLYPDTDTVERVRPPGSVVVMVSAAPRVGHEPILLRVPGKDGRAKLLLSRNG